ncbi:MAG: class I SAM-dependent methyltransferase [Chloroflexi bacterium]|nr:MAG: class I SAM-dependent methyltransferase [Chloroflexota bacterium]
MRQRPDSIAANIAHWTKNNRDRLDDGARADTWAEGDLRWGIFGVRESDLGSPLGDVRGLDVVELGCGTAYFSARLAKRGARPVGVDPTPAQLATARRMQEGTGIRFPLVEAPGELVPLPDASFDLAFSEYGASLWADPALWLPEAARLLRARGRLVFMTNSMTAILATPDVGDVTERLERPQKDMYRFEWPGELGVEFHLSHGEWIDRLRAAGFEIEKLIDVYATAESKRHDFYGYVDPSWARKWPAEEIWTARKR